MDLENASRFAWPSESAESCPGITPNELTRDVDVVAFFKGLGNGCALTQKGERQELPVFHGPAVGVVKPVLRETGAHEDAPPGVIDGRLVGEVSGEGHLIKNFHLASPRLPVDQLRSRRLRCRASPVAVGRPVGGWRSRLESGRLELGSCQQNVIEEIEALDAIDRSYAVDEDEHVAGLGDFAVRIVASLRWRLDASNLINGDERPLYLLHAAKYVLEVEISALSAVVDGFLLHGHVAAEFGEVLARLEIVCLKGCFDVAVIGNRFVRAILLDDLS